jgi:hypothetical protein
LSRGGDKGQPDPTSVPRICTGGKRAAFGTAGIDPRASRRDPRPVYGGRRTLSRPGLYESRSDRW